MDPRHFQQLASELVNGSSVAHMRTAISRAYYASYNVSVEILKNMGFSISEGPSGHGQIQRYLNNCGNQNVNKIGSQIMDLHSRRIDADYRLNKTSVENPKTAKALVKQAEKMIDALDTHCFGSERISIIEAIKSYKESTNQ